MNELLKNREHRFIDLKLNIGNLLVNVILNQGFWDVDSLWYSPPHCHSFFEIHYIQKGEIELIVSEKSMVLKGDEVCIIPPFTYHCTKKTLKPTKKISILISFQKDKSDQGKDDAYSYYKNVYCRLNRLISFRCTKSYFQDIIKTIENYEFEKPSRSYKLQNLLSLALIEATGTVADTLKLGADAAGPDNMFQEQDEDNVRRVKIESYICYNYNKNITLEDMAAFMFLSPRQTDRIVKEVTGLNFNLLLLKHRMEVAKLMMLNSEAPLGEIAVKLGYSSYNGFYKAFKSYVGLTPVDYIEKSKEERSVPV